MCGCDWNFVCSQCAGTPFDPHYIFEEPEPMDDAEFDELIRTPGPTERVWLT